MENYEITHFYVPPNAQVNCRNCSGLSVYSSKAGGEFEKTSL